MFALKCVFLLQMMPANIVFLKCTLIPDDDFSNYYLFSQQFIISQMHQPLPIVVCMFMDDMTAASGISRFTAQHGGLYQVMLWKTKRCTLHTVSILWFAMKLIFFAGSLAFRLDMIYLDLRRCFMIVNYELNSLLYVNMHTKKPSSLACIIKHVINVIYYICVYAKYTTLLACLISC